MIVFLLILIVLILLFGADRVSDGALFLIFGAIGLFILVFVLQFIGAMFTALFSGDFKTVFQGVGTVIMGAIGVALFYLAFTSKR